MVRNRSHTRSSARTYPRGTLSIVRGGYGFVQTPEGEYFVPASKLNGAFDGDLVEIAPARQERSRKALAQAKAPTDGRRREARVKRVIEHAHAAIVGRFERAEPFGVVVPEDPRIPYDIFTQLSECEGIADGAIVRVEMRTYPSHKEAATGAIVEVLGDDDDERLPIDLIVARHKLQTEFSQACLDEAGQASVDVEGALADGYVDVRERFVFTVDPADARDFDDAVSLERVRVRLGATGCGFAQCRTVGQAAAQAGQVALRADSQGAVADEGPRPGERELWRLGVHIADVSHYVSWASSVDLDARRRATSVYLVDRVIPMLPEALSNEVCSLKPHEDRRTMSVDMYLDDAGAVVGVDVYPALICSKARLTYEEAQGYIDAGADAALQGAGEEAGMGANAAPSGASREAGPRAGASPSAGAALEGELAWRIRMLSALAKKRARLREAAGGIDFDIPEAKVRLDDAGAPVEVRLRRRTDATQLIEEAMIAANEAVARYLRDAGFPCIYRTHDKPSHESLAGLVAVLQEFPWFKRVDSEAFAAGNPHAVAHVLAECADRSEGPLVTTLVLRSMKRALYEPSLGRHYALASEAYAHFTSPIRRYPDLVVHRMLKAALFGRPQKFDQEVASLPWIAEHSSEMERVAERAARDSQEAKIVELMESQVGQTFSAMISGVATYGLFVRLDNTAEGMVEIGDLGREYFALDPVRHTLTGSETGKEYRLGKHVAVRLLEADRRTCKLRFRLVRQP